MTHFKHYDLLTLEEDKPQQELTIGPQKVESTSLITVRAQLPTFCKADPEVFFLQAEAIFALHKITASLRKFMLVVAQLDGSVVRDTIDLVRAPPEENPYECLKDRIMKCYGQSTNARMRKLLEDQRLGDRRPSLFLNELRELGGPAVTDGILKSIWMRALPEGMQAALAASDHTNLSKLSEIADRIAELSDTRVYGMAAVRSSGVAEQEDKILTALDQLTQRIAALETRDRSADSKGDRQRSGSRSRYRNSRFCFYHDRFGNRATKCRAPCDWKTTNPSKPQGN